MTRPRRRTPSPADTPSRAPVLVISVAAERAGMHPQTLRHYDRLGLVTPARATGRGRRYSERDVARLREVQRLSQAGVSLEGVRRIIELEDERDQLSARLEAAEARIRELEAGRAPAADTAAQPTRAPRPRSSTEIVLRPSGQLALYWRR